MTEQRFNEKRIRWTCRRGMLELDVILIPFFERYFSSMDDELKATFVRLLEEADPDLFNWLMGHGQPEDEALAAMIRYINERIKP
ncbi:succinate dehydrogenase assembly factor 2 [Pleionea sp. CnH1-48]|uniref:FAD assembly factor SdhE n=1 Tax=Pleionea sp. CnH1-48 TaxID=2954494 RepID=UPI002096F7E9|nr:succinate dehydrogenase assembly factor 2 [Pleionea sp. CnH1-48]MCO7225476.1 succinate dehydrogenase assembly factor 2 [Pleionea sp. CnH1-48]